jgi:hypothetical protein
MNTDMQDRIWDLHRPPVLEIWRKIRTEDNKDESDVSDRDARDTDVSDESDVSN